jgi:hypothetical protein
MLSELRTKVLAMIAAYMVLIASAATAWAAPYRLNCVLTDMDAKPKSENRSVIIMLDEDKKTLTAEEGDRSYSFTKVTITSISISGQADNVSVGIDRSSLGIVWQQYGTDKVATEFGYCHIASPAN